MKIKQRLKSSVLERIVLSASILILFLILVSSAASALSYSPKMGPVGTLVTFKDGDFSDVSEVYFENTAGLHLDRQPNEITVEVPDGYGSVDIYIKYATFPNKRYIGPFTYVDKSNNANAIADMKTGVQNLVMSRTLSQNTGNRLINDLASAETNIDKGNTAEAKNALNDFTAVINNILGKAKKLTSQHRADLTTLVNKANSIISSI